jgi:hypothetical protein
MQVLFRGPESREWQRDLSGPLTQWLALEGATIDETDSYRLEHAQDTQGHARPGMSSTIRSRSHEPA